MIEDKVYWKYARDVVDGKIVAGDLIKLACKRFLSDLERDDLEFREKAVDRVIKFVSLLKHNTGQFVGKPFKLLPWQEWIVANIYGFYWKDGYRRFNNAYIEIARKNGKTAISAALALYGLMADKESAAQVIGAANSKEQAKILLTQAAAFTKSIDPKQKLLHPFRNEIKFPTTDSFLKIVSADTSKLDGLNCSTFVLDEYHAAKDTKMYDVLKSSMGMRRNPLSIIITTAGFDLNSPCYKKRGVGIEILNGVKQDDSQFYAIYTIDEDDDWTDESVWAKACPCLDITVTKKYMREQVQSAKNNPSEEVGVKTKTLNVWCSSSDVWIPEHYILKSTVDKFEIDEEAECYVGVDLAAVSDLTAVSYMYVKDGKFYFKNLYYLPETALTESRDRELYKLWKRTGQLIITPGNVTDYDYITNDLMGANEGCPIRSVSYDPYNSTQWAIDATTKGLPLEQYPQNIGNFNKPTRELERLLLSNQVRLDNNEITRWCFRNVVLKSDSNGNVKPDKSARRNKIDGTIAMIQAVGTYLNNPRYNNSILTI